MTLVLEKSSRSDGGVHVIRSDAEALEVARRLAADIATGAIARDRTPVPPFAELDALSAAGLFGITVPRSFGGAEVSVATLVEVFRILSVADPAIGQLPQNHFLFVEAIRLDGSPAQQEFFFGELLGGARFGNAQAERGGTSALDLRTRLERNGDALRLNGTKYYCTGALTAHWIPVAAIDPEGRQILAFVRKSDLGVDVLGDWDVIGQRTTFSGTAHFVDVVVPDEHVIEHWRVFDRPTLFHSLGVLLHASIDVGIARAALEDMIAAIRTRGRPRLGARAASALEDRLLLTRLGELAIDLAALEASLAQAARLHDDASTAGLSDLNSADAAVASLAVKAFAEDVALAAATELFALTGSASASANMGYDRHWRNARVHTVHDANQWRTLQVGEWQVSGIPPAKPVRRPV